MALDQCTCSHGSEKRGSGHCAIEKGEGLGVGAAGSEGVWVDLLFFFDNGGEVGSDRRDDEDECEA